MSYMNKGSMPTTVIVSRLPDRSGNFVCNGTADNVEIQAALAFVSALAGGSVFIKKGTSNYIIDASISIPSNIVIDSDYAILQADWAVDYVAGAPLPATHPPIFYNSNYSVIAYGQNSDITIKNLILQGIGGGGAGTESGAIPIRVAGCDNFHIENCKIDNETLRTGVLPHLMAQSSISVGRYNRRTRITDLVIFGGWTGIYLSSPNEAFADEPTVGAGANLDTFIHGFDMRYIQGSNPFTPMFSIGVKILDGHTQGGDDYFVDCQRVKQLEVGNVDFDGNDEGGTPASIGIFIGTGTLYCEDLNFHNLTIRNLRNGVGIGAFIAGSSNITNVTISDVEAVAAEAFWRQQIANVNGYLQFTNCSIRNDTPVGGAAFFTLIAPATVSPASDYTQARNLTTNFADTTLDLVRNSNERVFRLIQTAITDLGALGGWVKVPKGTFAEVITIANNNIILEGSGWSTIINGGTTGTAVSVTGNDCILRDFQAMTTPEQGNAYRGILGNGADNIRIINIFVNGSDDDGIYGGGINAVIEKCLIYNIDGRGIYWNQPNLKIVHTKINDCGSFGVHLESTADYTIMSDLTIDTTADDGIVIASDHNIIDSSVRIVNWTNEAIDDNGVGSMIGGEHTYVFGILGVVTGGATSYPLAGQGAEQATELFIPLPYRGYVRDLHVYALTAAGGAVTDTITARINNGDTIVTCTLVGAAVSSSDITNRVQTAAIGDRLSISYVAGGGSVAADIIIVVEVREVKMA